MGGTHATSRSARRPYFCGVFDGFLERVRIPPSPPPILGNEKVLQNQALLEPPVFGGGAPRRTILAFLGGICEPNKSPVGRCAVAFGFPPARPMEGKECTTPKARAVETLGTPQGSPAFHRFSSGLPCWNDYSTKRRVIMRSPTSLIMSAIE